MKEMLILSPGPANISERVRRALTAPGIKHREEEFTSLSGVSSGVLIFSNGVYGERAAQIAQVFGIPHTLEKLDWTHLLPLTFSTDLVSTMSKEEDGETPFTPPVQTMYALREAARELLEEGVQNRISHYRGIAKTLRDGLESLEMDLLVPREHLSNTMTTVMLPEGWSYPELHAPLKERGYAIYKPRGN